MCNDMPLYTCPSVSLPVCPVPCQQVLVVILFQSYFPAGLVFFLQATLSVHLSLSLFVCHGLFCPPIILVVIKYSNAPALKTCPMNLDCLFLSCYCSSLFFSLFQDAHVCSAMQKCSFHFYVEIKVLCKVFWLW